MTYNRTKGIGPRGLGVSPLKQKSQRDIAPTEKKEGGKGLRKMNNRELYIRDMKRQNDSLRKLPRTDPHHLPTFDTSTKKGSQAQKDFYTPSPENEKLRKLRKLGDKLRKKHDISPLKQLRKANSVKRNSTKVTPRKPPFQVSRADGTGLKKYNDKGILE